MGIGTDQEVVNCPMPLINILHVRSNLHVAVIKSCSKPARSGEARGTLAIIQAVDVLQAMDGVCAPVISRDTKTVV